MKGRKQQEMENLLTQDCHVDPTLDRDRNALVYGRSPNITNER